MLCPLSAEVPVARVALAGLPGVGGVGLAMGAAFASSFLPLFGASTNEPPGVGGSALDLQFRRRWSGVLEPILSHGPLLMLFRDSDLWYADIGCGFRQRPSSPSSICKGRNSSKGFGRVERRHLMIGREWVGTWLALRAGAVTKSPSRARGTRRRQRPVGDHSSYRFLLWGCGSRS